ncbi:MAG TPA: ABC transporter family substrate-binding protein [Acidimicrobiales bacterium]|nr:ABC transporter family substrate-binding protein [Acidimicrobiales bacterium]
MTSALVGVVTVALLATACTSSSNGQGPASPPTSARGPQPAQEGGFLSFALERQPASFNLHTRKGYDLQAQLIMDRVWPQVFLLDSQGIPHLDTNFVKTAELDRLTPQTVVYQIDDRATWSDGVPITADDFVYNWQAQSGDPLYTDVGGRPFDAVSIAGYSQIASVTGSNRGKTVTVVFKTPYGSWESLFNNLIPAHIARTVGWNTGFDAFGPAIISGGPYLVQSDTPGQQIVLARNPRYWGPPAHLDTIALRSVPDQAQDAPALQSGGVNVVYPATPQVGMVQQVRQIGTVASSTAIGFTFEHLDFNQRNAFLKLLPVRQAIAKAIDRPQLIAAGPAQINQAIKTDNDHLYVNSQQGYSDNGGGYEQGDTAGARKLLTGAGFAEGADGYFQLAGAPLELRMSTTSDDPARVAAEGLIADQLKRAGIKVDLANAPTATLLDQVLPSGNFDLALSSSVSSAFPSDNAARYVSGGSTGSFDGYANPKVDTLFEQANSELNAGKAGTIYNEIDQQLWADMVSLPLYPDPTFLAHLRGYVNIADNPSASGPFWNAEQWGLVAPATQPGS